MISVTTMAQTFFKVFRLLWGGIEVSVICTKTEKKLKKATLLNFLETN